MDDETGEVNYRLHIQTNEETGENEYLTCCLNKETGEQEYFSIDRICDSLQMPNLFKISRYTTQLATIVERINPRHKSNEKYTQFITAIVFLIPTVIIFTPILGVFILTFDILLHKWCHRQNNKLKFKRNDTVYYQSPLYAMYKEFCSQCIAEEACKKMNKIHDIRYNRKRFLIEESMRRVVA